MRVDVHVCIVLCYICVVMCYALTVSDVLHANEDEAAAISGIHSDTPAAAQW